MKPVIVLAAALGSAAIVAVAQPSTRLPAPWMLMGKSPTEYEAGLGPGIARGSDAKYLRHMSGDGRSWAALGQSISAENYRGKRIRFEAKVKTEGVSQWGGLWMNIAAGAQPVGFYNTQQEPLSGDSDWTSRAVVLDVPENATRINFGALCAGRGTVRIDELKFEVVGKDVPLSRFDYEDKMRRTPVL